MQQRQDPYNQLGQLLGLSGQVGQPSFQQTQQFGPMAPNYHGRGESELPAAASEPVQLWAGLIGGLGASGE